VFVHTNQSIRAEVMRIFDSTFAITYALEAIAIFVGILGVSGTLLTLILERRREIASLRLAGADRRQVRKMVVIEAGLIGLVSQSIGLAAGLGLATILIYVINVQSFGWTIQFDLPVGFLVQSSLALLAATTLAGLYPARIAAAVTPIERPEE
jgi:putative ABC transport system permease protein